MNHGEIAGTDIEVIERLRALEADCSWREVLAALLGHEESPTGCELRNRLVELIGHGDGHEVDVTALLGVVSRLEDDADYGSWQAETAERIRKAVEGEGIPKQVRDVPHCPRCLDDGFWSMAPADAEGFETLRCAGCGKDYRYKRPAKGSVR